MSDIVSVKVYYQNNITQQSDILLYLRKIKRESIPAILSSQEIESYIDSVYNEGYVKICINNDEMFLMKPSSDQQEGYCFSTKDPLVIQFIRGRDLHGVTPEVWYKYYHVFNINPNSKYEALHAIYNTFGDRSGDYFTKVLSYNVQPYVRLALQKGHKGEDVAMLFYYYGDYLPNEPTDKIARKLGLMLAITNITTLAKWYTEWKRGRNASRVSDYDEAIYLEQKQHVYNEMEIALRDN